MSAVRLHGLLAGHARSYTTSAGRAVLRMLLQLPGGGCVDALWLRETGHAAQYACTNAARQLRKGTPVTVHCAGLLPDGVGQPLIAAGVDFVEYSFLTTDHTAPTPALENQEG